MLIRFIIHLLQITGLICLVVINLMVIPFYASLAYDFWNKFICISIGIFLVNSANSLIFLIYAFFKQGKVVICIALSILLIATYFLNTFISLDFFFRYLDWDVMGTFYSVITIPAIINLLPLLFNYLSLVLEEYKND